MKYKITEAKISHKDGYSKIPFTDELIGDVEVYRYSLYKDNKKLIDSLYNPLIDSKPVIILNYEEVIEEN